MKITINIPQELEGDKDFILTSVKSCVNKGTYGGTFKENGFEWNFNCVKKCYLVSVCSDHSSELVNKVDYSDIFDTLGEAQQQAKYIAKQMRSMLMNEFINELFSDNRISIDIEEYYCDMKNNCLIDTYEHFLVDTICLTNGGNEEVYKWLNSFMYLGEKNRRAIMFLDNEKMYKLAEDLQDNSFSWVGDRETLRGWVIRFLTELSDCEDCDNFDNLINSDSPLKFIEELYQVRFEEVM